MKNFVHEGIPVFVSCSRICSVSEENNQWVVKAFNPTFNTYRTFYLPKDKVKKEPNVGEWAQTYEVIRGDNLIGCDIDGEPVWHPDVQEADYMN